MDISMKLVEAQCGRYLTMFSDCIAKYPYTWHMDCERQKLKLAKCAEFEPTIVMIKEQCKKQFSQYESCVNENPTETFNCVQQYALFNKCAEQYITPEHKEKVKDVASRPMASTR